MGVGPEGTGAVIIRSGGMGAYISTRAMGGHWTPAFWGPDDANRVVDVTGMYLLVDCCGAKSS